MAEYLNAIVYFVFKSSNIGINHLCQRKSNVVRVFFLYLFIINYYYFNNDNMLLYSFILPQFLIRWYVKNYVLFTYLLLW